MLVGHKTNEEIYGEVEYSWRLDTLFFVRWRWQEVNQKKPIPKVCAEIVRTAKEIGNDFWNSFKPLDKSEFLQRETQDYQKHG